MATAAAKPRIEIVNDPKPDMRKASTTIDVDGLVTIEIASDQPDKPEPATNAGFDRNLAADMDDGALASLASYLLDGIEADLADRGEWEETVDRAADYLGIKIVDPVSSVAADGTITQAVATCMLQAALKLWGTGYSELLPTDGPVKVERIDPVPTEAAGPGLGHNGGPPMGGIVAGAEPSEPGQDPVTESDEQGDDLADALERDLNWYLTTGDKGYYPDFSKMLMNRNLLGMGFREVYKCPIQRKPISRWIMAQDLIVSGSPAHLADAGRVTARKKIRQSQMKRMQVAGHYLDVQLNRPTGITSATELVVGATEGVASMPSLPRDYQHTIYECSCELGFDDDELFGEFDALKKDENGKMPGYPLPYRVTIEVDTRTVLSIKRNWKRGDEDHQARPRYVKYGFMPAFGGGFYDWGLLHIVGNPTQAATMLQRSGVDAGVLANFPAWVMATGPGSRLESTVFRPGPGEGIKFPTSGGAKLSDVLMPWPYKEPSAQSLALSSKLEADVAKLAGVIEIPVGEGRIGNTPVGTIMSYIESVSMVPGAVHKADHAAQAEEFELLRELIAEEPEVLWRGNKSPARRWQVAEEVLSANLSPRADPNTPSQIHRLLKIQGQIMLGGLPQFAGIADNRAIYKHATEILVGTDAAEYTLPQAPPSAPPPDPKVVAAQIKAQSQATSDQAKQQGAELAHQGKMAELQAEGQNRAADRESDETRAAMSLQAAKIKADADATKAGQDRAHDTLNQHADRVVDVAKHASTLQQQALSPPLSGNGEPDGG